MPTAPRIHPPLPVAGPRLLVAALAAVILATAVALAPEPVEGRNWSRQIAATRASQLYYENAMRAADRQIKQLKRSKKQTQRKIKKSRRNLVRIKARRAELGARYRGTLETLTEAREAYAAAQVPPPSIDVAVDVVEVAGLALDAPEDTTEQPAPDAYSPLAIGSGPIVPATTTAYVSTAEIDDLKQRVKKQRKAYGKIKRKTRRVQRALAARVRSLNAMARQRRAAIARRESAEAALGSRILAMSRLAQQRAAKKTKVRPGRNSGFAWPIRGRISQSYGCTGFYLNPRRGSCAHFHDGLDIVSYRGAPIRSAAVGVVSYIGWNPWDQHGRAFMIVVAHPGGYETLYGHVLPRRAVRVGQLVRRGEVIGYMGNTGRSTGVHVHLELRRGRTTLNPLAYL